MKKLLYISFLILSFAANAQRKYEAFDILNENIIVPPNGILLSGNVFMDDAEVMNTHYLEYLHFLAQDSSDEAIIKAYPDTSIFGTRHLTEFLKLRKGYYKKTGNKHKPVSLLFHDDEVLQPTGKHHWYNYFSYREKRHYPLVGVDYEQAISYCKWRSDFVSNHFNNVLKKKSKYKAFRNQHVRFEFFLPTDIEWEASASSGLDPTLYPLGSKEIQGDSAQYFNISFTSKTEKLKSKTEPEYIYSHYPNTAGFYNLIGNVSELTAVKGISKGGSYLHTASECQIKKSIAYTKPHKWLGFRCVCKVVVTQINN